MREPQRSGKTGKARPGHEHGSYLIALLALGGCTAESPSDRDASAGNITDETIVELVSHDGPNRACFRVPAGVYYSIGEDRQEMGFRFATARDLENALSTRPKKQLFGDNIAALTIWSNEAQKLGAIGYRRSSSTLIDLGKYDFYVPPHRSSMQTVLIPKVGYVAIRFYPAAAAPDLPALTTEAGVLGHFVDRITIDCERSGSEL